MKKQYKLSIEYDDKCDEVDSLSEVLEEIGDESIWLDTGEITIQLPMEIAKYIESDGILGITWSTEALGGSGVIERNETLYSK